MPFISFHDLFPEVAERETRTITVFENNKWGLPPDEYGFAELFCNEVGCDCRRVMLSVVSRNRRRLETVIAYGWESLEFYARWMKEDDPAMVRELKGPVPNLGSPHSAIAEPLLEMASDVLFRDAAYVERLKTHYRMFRRVIDAPGRKRGKHRRGKLPGRLR